MPLPVLKSLALHIGRDRHIELLQNRWRHVHQLEARQFAAARALAHSRIMLDDDTELSMVAVVRPGIVIEGVNRAMTNRADGAPEEVAEVDDQVWWHAVTGFVNFLWLEDACADIRAGMVGQGL